LSLFLKKINVYDHLMPAIEHADKIAGSGFAYRTKINVNNHEDRKNKTGYDMDQIGKMNSAKAKYPG
jgi:hypothetical protein